MTKILIVYQQCRFLAKILTFDKKIDFFTRILIFEQNFDFQQKIRFLTEVSSGIRFLTLSFVSPFKTPSSSVRRSEKLYECVGGSSSCAFASPFSFPDVELELLWSWSINSHIHFLTCLTLTRRGRRSKLIFIFSTCRTWRRSSSPNFGSGKFSPEPRPVPFNSSAVNCVSGAWSSSTLNKLYFSFKKGRRNKYL